MPILVEFPPLRLWDSPPPSHVNSNDPDGVSILTLVEVLDTGMTSRLESQNGQGEYYSGG